MPITPILAALSDAHRRAILLALKQGRMPAGELAEAVGLTPQALSYHLAKLKKAGLIFESRRGNFIDYEANLSILDEAILWLNDLRGGAT